MTPEQFAYWLQGYAELNGAPPSPEQWQIIRDHLALVFDKRTLSHLSPPKMASPIPQWGGQPYVGTPSSPISPVTQITC